MPLPALTFTPSDPIDDYLVQFPDVSPWLTAQGISLGQMGGEKVVRWWDLRADAQPMLEQIALEFSRPRWAETTDWAQESLSDLVHHVIDVHHGFCRAEIPRLRCLFAALARAQPEAASIQVRFEHLSTVFLGHLDEEELRLFPLCLAIDHSRFSLQLPPAQILREGLHHLDSAHRQADADFAELLQDCLALKRASLASTVLTAICLGLENFAADLVVHCEKETAILLPAVTHLYELLETRQSTIPSIRRQE